MGNSFLFLYPQIRNSNSVTPTGLDGNAGGLSSLRGQRNINTAQPPDPK